MDYLRMLPMLMPLWLLTAGLGAHADTVQACRTEPFTELQSANDAADRLLTALGKATRAKGRPDADAESVVPAETLGATGDGRADDTRALQDGLSRGRRIWLSSGKVYRITRRLDIGPGSGLVSDGSATLWMAAGNGAFNNSVARRSDDALYGPRGTGLRVEGHGALLQGFFLVKAFEDNRYVIGIDVRRASQARLQALKLRGFSLAPGIVTVRSSNDVLIQGLLIHDACTASTHVPEDVPSFQVTGISVDDTRVDGRGSTRLRIVDNVITDLRMLPHTRRGNQSDGINFAGMGTGEGSVIAGNDISGVDEGIDLWGAEIEVSGNRVSAEEPGSVRISVFEAN